MKFISISFLASSLVIMLLGCNQSSDSESGEKNQSEEKKEENKVDEKEIPKMPEDFIPDGSILFEKISGDLNKDGLEDVVIITKQTDTSRIVQDEYLGELDRNRRGIIVAFKKGEGYDLIVQNDTCFSSENEDGGVYFPPELMVEIGDGKLFMHYAHGRYGFWRYTFRLKEDDFELIGYDQSDHQGPILHYSYSYNFLTGKKLTKENVNFYSENPQDEVFKETWETIANNKRLLLSEIEDFDVLSFD